MSHSEIRIRAATRYDQAAVPPLARQIARRQHGGGALVAEDGGEIIAAIDLTSGGVVVDQSRSTHEIVHALRRSRYELLRQGGAVRHARFSIARAANRITPLPVTQF
ncbi:MAG: hypothetical protein JO363_08470 [Solirubrobacterales bacterium]|nr:hypothetical protein [Solirubrobacterales bacterium]